MDFLKNNAFRILALPATASERETFERLDEVRSMSQVGITRSYPLDAFWPGVCRDPDAIEHVVELLHNPIRRMEQALFWFWEVTETDRKAIQCLEKGDTFGAELIWQIGAEGQSGGASGSAVKNFAQLLTCKMFDPSLPNADFRRVRNRAIALWERLFRSPALWHKLDTIANCGNMNPDHEEMSRLFFKALSNELDGKRSRQVQSCLSAHPLAQQAASSPATGFECGPDICLEDLARFLFWQTKECCRKFAAYWAENSVKYAIGLVPLTITISLLLAVAYSANHETSPRTGTRVQRDTVIIIDTKKPNAIPVLPVPVRAKKASSASRALPNYPLETSNEKPVENIAPDVEQDEPKEVDTDIQYFSGDETGASIEDTEENEETDVSADQDEEPVETVEASSDNE